MTLFITGTETKLQNETVLPPATQSFVTRTNFAFGVETLVPKGFAVLMLHDGGTNHQTSGAIITADSFRPGEVMRMRPPLRQQLFKSGEKPRLVL